MVQKGLRFSWVNVRKIRKMSVPLPLSCIFHTLELESWLELPLPVSHNTIFCVTCPLSQYSLAGEQKRLI